MKAVIVVTVSLLLTPFIGVQAQERTELRGAVVLYVPSDDDIWDSGLGVEAQARFWQTETLGFAIAGGIAVWDVELISGSLFDFAGRNIANFNIDGEVSLIPLGGSILARPVHSETVTVTFEGGIRYVIADSDAEVAFATATTTGRREIDADDGIVGLFQADLEIAVSEDVSLFGGAGFQFDIEKSEVTVDISGILFEEEVKLQALFLKAGVLFRL